MWLPPAIIAMISPMPWNAPVRSYMVNYAATYINKYNQDGYDFYYSIFHNML